MSRPSALLAGVTLDGIPENMALGVSLLESSGAGALTLLVAIFFSNLPEALGGAVGMRQQGRSRGFAIGVWSATAVVLAVAVVLGNVALSGVGEGRCCSPSPGARCSPRWQTR
jgi:zinc transporter, ZIP family